MNDPAYYSLSRPEILAAVPPACKRVLSVGCGFGMTEATLVERKAEVWGIERETVAAEQASRRLYRVICGDAETVVDQLPAAYFDCLIMADILEHLVDPWSTLARYRTKLREGGVLIASVPNVRYVGVVLRLVALGQWEYVDSGVLDRTHLRFFTRKSATALTSGAGFGNVEVWPRVRNVPSIQRLATLVQRGYYTLPLLREFLAKQFLIRGQLVPTKTRL